MSKRSKLIDLVSGYVYKPMNTEEFISFKNEFFGAYNSTHEDICECQTDADCQCLMDRLGIGHHIVRDLKGMYYIYPRFSREVKEDPWKWMAIDAYNMSKTISEGYHMIDALALNLKQSIEEQCLIPMKGNFRIGVREANLIERLQIKIDSIPIKGDHRMMYETVYKFLDQINCRMFVDRLEQLELRQVINFIGKTLNYKLFSGIRAESVDELNYIFTMCDLPYRLSQNAEGYCIRKSI